MNKYNMSRSSPTSQCRRKLALKDRTSGGDQRDIGQRDWTENRDAIRFNLFETIIIVSYPARGSAPRWGSSEDLLGFLPWKIS